MKEEGYRVDGLPASSKELEKIIMAEGAVYGTYADGVVDRFLKESHPLLVSREEYESWVRQGCARRNMPRWLPLSGSSRGSI